MILTLYAYIRAQIYVEIGQVLALSTLKASTLEPQIVLKSLLITISVFT